MEFELSKEKSQDVRVGTGQVARAMGIFALSLVVTAGLSIGAFRLGFESASAGIYERQAAKAEQLNAGLTALVGIVDQAKAREFASCVQTGRSDCASIIAQVSP